MLKLHMHSRDFLLHPISMLVRRACVLVSHPRMGEHGSEPPVACQESEEAPPHESSHAACQQPRPHFEDLKEFNMHAGG